MSTLHDTVHQLVDRVLDGEHLPPPDAVPRPATERISTVEAARRLGITATAVRRRVASGALHGEWGQRPQGKRLWIRWDSSVGVAQDAKMDASLGHADATRDANQGQGGAHAELFARIRWLEERLEQAEVERARAAEERAELRRMLMFEQQRAAELTRMLPAGREPGMDATATPTPTSHVAQPWWRRVLRALSEGA